ncbi:MAG: MBL fold metallo-hydrolase [Erysipelotrichaceae bacterium]|nr:MBL fold metallo-hydrolase [Erysipelotrichaceae bacterium]
MKYLKNLFLFRAVFLFVICAYLKQPLLYVLSIIYLLVKNYKESILFVVICLFSLGINTFVHDAIPVGVVQEVNNSYVVIDKFLYRVKVYDTDFETGNLVYCLEKGERVTDKKELKNTYKYSGGTYKKLIEKTPLYYSYKRIENFDKTYQDLIKKLLFNQYVMDDELDFYLGHGFALYYLLKAVYRKNKKLSLAVVFLFSLIFGFKYKYLLLILEVLLNRLNRIDKLSVLLLIFGLINIESLLNYSILLPLIFMFISISEYKDSKIVVPLIQSIFFGEVQLGVSFFYKFYMYIRINILMVVLIAFIIPVISPFTLWIINLLSKVLKLMSFSVRGQISVVSVLLIFVINKLIKNENSYIFLLIFILVLGSPFNKPFLKVSYIDVGQGDACLISGYFDSYHVLIDTGSKYNYSKLKNYLLKEGIYTLDYVLISHDDEDHSGNLSNLKKDFKVKNVISEKGDVSIKGLFLKNLYIDEFDNDNDNSLVYETYIKDTHFLFTGDISSKAERELLSKYDIEDVDFLKVSHHGSKTGSSAYFISRILPKVSVISTNGKFDHPSIECLNNLNSYKSNIYISKEKGDIEVYFFNSAKIIKSGMSFDIMVS